MHLCQAVYLIQLPAFSHQVVWPIDYTQSFKCVVKAQVNAAQRVLYMMHALSLNEDALARA